MPETFEELRTAAETNVSKMLTLVYGKERKWYYQGRGPETGEALRDAVVFVLNTVGDRALCKEATCRRPIWWVTHGNSNRAPYTDHAVNHFIDCPASRKFSKKAKDA